METFDLPVYCYRCGQPLTATVGPSTPDVEPASWTCPACGESLTLDFGGPLLTISKREEPALKCVPLGQPSVARDFLERWVPSNRQTH
jgi:transposase-like protein